MLFQLEIGRSVAQTAYVVVTFLLMAAVGLVVLGNRRRR
jgi:hypothetical protein